MSKVTATSMFRKLKITKPGRVFGRNVTVSEISLKTDMGKHFKPTQPGEGDEGKDSKKETKKIVKSIGWFSLKTAAISGIVIGGITVTVPALGFTASGVAAGSLAAFYQSVVLGGTIAAGSMFATLQSIGAIGLAASAKAGIVAGSAAVTGAHTLYKKRFGKKQ